MIGITSYIQLFLRLDRNSHRRKIVGDIAFDVLHYPKTGISAKFAGAEFIKFFHRL